MNRVRTNECVHGMAVCGLTSFVRSHQSFILASLDIMKKTQLKAQQKAEQVDGGRAAVLSSRASLRVGTLMPFERACLGRAKSAQCYSYTGSISCFFNDNFGSEVRGQRWIRLSLLHFSISHSTRDRRGPIRLVYATSIGA